MGASPALEQLIAALEELETLQRDQIEQCLGPAGRKKKYRRGTAQRANISGRNRSWISEPRISIEGK